MRVVYTIQWASQALNPIFMPDDIGGDDGAIDKLQTPERFPMTAMAVLTSETGCPTGFTTHKELTIQDDMMLANAIIVMAGIRYHADRKGDYSITTLAKEHNHIGTTQDFAKTFALFTRVTFASKNS